MKIIIATNNANKLREIREIFSGRAEIVSLREAGITSDPEETGTTFAENARIKALSAMRLSGLPAIADDSGICVNALGGGPGIFSARFAGEPCDNEKNNALLLEKLKNAPDRTACYACAMCMLFPDGRELTSFGTCEGVITEDYRGKGGFGYDPLFYVPSLGKTFGEATPEEKNAISHRAKALRELWRKWSDLSDK